MSILKKSSPRYLFLLALHIVFVGLAVAQAPYLAGPGRTLVRAGKLVDVRTGEEAAGKTIVVTGDKVTAIAETSATPAGARSSTTT